MLQEVNGQLRCGGPSQQVAAAPSASPAPHRLPLSPVLQEASQRVVRRYRKAKLRRIQRREYLKLRAIVPAVAKEDKVSKVSHTLTHSHSTRQPSYIAFGAIGGIMDI